MASGKWSLRVARRLLLFLETGSETRLYAIGCSMQHEAIGLQLILQLDKFLMQKDLIHFAVNKIDS